MVVFLFTGPLLGQLDAVAIGREHAINLGADHQGLVRRCLIAIGGVCTVLSGACAVGIAAYPASGVGITGGDMPLVAISPPAWSPPMVLAEWRVPALPALSSPIAFA